MPHLFAEQDWREQASEDSGPAVAGSKPEVLIGITMMLEWKTVQQGIPYCDPNAHPGQPRRVPEEHTVL